MDNIDKILYINLSHRTDRNKNVIDQITKLNLMDKLVRINAINGHQLDIMNISNSLITDQGKANATNTKLPVYIPLTKGAIGCALSHRDAYKYIIDNNLTNALILEDDVTIDPNIFKIKLAKLMEMTPKDYDVLFIGYHNSTIQYIDKKINDSISKPLMVYGLFGYIVSNKGAKKLLNVFPITRQIDTEISFKFNEINAYVVNPDDRIVFSDSSSPETKFGTDIQIREEYEGQNTDSSSFSNYYICIFVMSILMMFLFIFILCIFMKFCYVV